jgi:hypothetical protein
MHKTKIAFAFLLLLVGTAWQLSAQGTTGKITGIVTDATGAVIPNANVVVTNVATAVSHQTTTDTSGVYQVLQLPIGSYKVTVTAPGFEQTTVASKTALEINETLRVDVQMQVGRVSGEVTVESAASQVETQNSTVGATVSGQAIFELPLNGRNTLDLLKTQPGVTPTNPDSGAAGGYSIGGMRTDSVTYLLDGGNNTDLLSNGVVANPNPDAVAEFRVIENNYSAEYGRNAGGIVSVVSKSGTNSFHGTAFDYVRNNFFNANTFFNNEEGLSVPVLKRNQFGVTFGGPIKKDKLFFFFSYEGQRQTALDTSPGKVSAFTPAELNGNFSGTSYASAVGAFLVANPYYQANPTLAAQGIIDPTKIDPVAKAYISHNLLPVSPAGYLFPQAVASDNFDEYLGKLDYNITGKDILSATLTARDNPILYPFGPSPNPPYNVAGSPVTYERATYFASVAYTHTFSPNVLNEARVTAQRFHNNQAIPATKLPTDQSLGINVINDQATGPAQLFFLGSNITTGPSHQGPTTEIDNTYAFNDTLSWVRGSHNFKFGFYFSPYQNNTVYDFYVNGAFYFYGPSTGVGSTVDLADFLMGNPDEYLQFGKAPSNIRSHQYAGFAQDDWHLSKRLTINLGLRYEYASPKYDTQGRSFSFIPGLQSQRFPNAPNGLVFPGDPGAPKGSNFPDKNDFGPRAGFAYDVFGNAKTSIRGGFGMFYDILKGEDNLQYNGQAPFFGFADVFPVTYTGTGLSGLQDPYGSSGTIDPFPSRPPAHNINFADAGFLPFGGGGVYFVDPKLRTPYVFQYNLSVQQQLPSSMLLEVGYLGYSAHKLTGLVDVNPFPLPTNQLPSPTQRIYGSNYSYLDEFQNIGKAHYSSMIVNLTRRFADMGRLGSSFFTVGYTWGHEIDNSSGFRERNPNIPFYNHDAFYGSGDTDVRQTFVISGGWTLPFDKLWSSGPKLLTSGWSLYPIFTMRTGFPLDISAGLNTTRKNPGPSGAGDAGYVHADLVGNNVITLDPSQLQTLSNPNAGGTVSSGNYYFNPANFSIARLTALDTSGMSTNFYPYGTFPRNGLRGPGQTNLDLSISKHFPITERVNLELRGDAFNILNHTQFQSPDLIPTDATFGQISTTYDPRILQLALHLAF